MVAILRCSDWLYSTRNRDDQAGGIIPCIRIRSSSPARFTILYSHANAEDLGFLWKVEEYSEM